MFGQYLRFAIARTMQKVIRPSIAEEIVEGPNAVLGERPKGAALRRRLP